MEKTGLVARIDRRFLYAFCGLSFGVMAPLGWTVLQLLFFRQAGQGIWQQIAGNILHSGESLFLYLYMGGGTGLVLATFGFLIGRASQQIHDRASRLDELNQTIALQKESFERKFEELNNNIKSFHAINASIQRSLDHRDVLRLAAECLHEILGYDRVNVLMVNHEKNQMEFIASRGSGNDEVEGIILPLDVRSGALYKTILEKRVFLIEDMARMPEEFHLRAPYDNIHQLRSRHFILCPILVRGEAVGLLAIDNKLKRKVLTETDVDTVKLFAVQIATALDKINLLDAVEALTRELEFTFQELLKYRGEHTSLDHSLHAATNSTTEAIGDIVGAADVVREAVDSTRSAASEISVSIEQVSQNINQLNDFMERTISAMLEISATVREVHENGVRSQGMSEQVKQQAEEGVKSVVETLAGLQGISAAVEGAEGAIERLSSKGEEIGGITTVISEITQRTNLLALNAAIIAAQAGEHGRSFAVVADEVRSLSQEAAHSTGAIASLINEIQEYTRETVNHIGKTRKLVQQGVALGQGTEVSLRQILNSAASAMDMARDIRRATEEISRSVESVSQSVERLGEMAAQISVASREQSQGTRNIVQSIEEIRNMADDMASSTEKQKRNTQDIESAVQSVSAMVGRIFGEMEQRQQGSQVVIESLEQLKNSGEAEAVR
jgi:methyl-accepting chemotaxis protein